MCLEHNPAPGSTEIRISWCSGSRSQSWFVIYSNPGNSWWNDYSGGALTHVWNGSFVTTQIAAHEADHGLDQQWSNS